MGSINNRLGEAGNVPVRADRFFAAQGEWYFSTREGTPMGPFEDKQEAKNGLQDFIEFMNLAEPKTLSKLYHALQPSNVPLASSLTASKTGRKTGHKADRTPG